MRAPGRSGALRPRRQPWASLIVHGIRTLETRGFVPSYRGYIWIHATSAEPEVDVR